VLHFYFAIITFRPNIKFIYYQIKNVVGLGSFRKVWVTLLLHPVLEIVEVFSTCYLVGLLAPPPWLSANISAGLNDPIPKGRLTAIETVLCEELALSGTQEHYHVPLVSGVRVDARNSKFSVRVTTPITLVAFVF
jgi:hypothetical protein